MTICNLKICFTSEQCGYVFHLINAQWKILRRPFAREEFILIPRYFFNFMRK